MQNYYIAVDFDGTLVEHKFPEIGEPREDVKQKLFNHINVLNHHGFSPTLILWTCREDLPERAYLTEAVDWCKEHEIPIKYVNENPECDFGYPEKVRKIVANEYWDDKAFKV